jgi:hypothetical protein
MIPALLAAPATPARGQANSHPGPAPDFLTTRLVGRVEAREPLVPEGESADIVFNGLAISELEALLKVPHRVTNLVFGREDHLVSFFGDGGVSVWDVVTSREVRRITTRSAWSVPLSMSPDGRMLVVAESPGNLYLWNTSSYEPSIAADWADALAISWQRAGMQDMRLIGGLTWPILSAAVDPGGRRLAVLSEGGFATIWDLSTEDVFAALVGDRKALSLALDPDGRRLAMGTSTGRVELLDVKDGTKLWQRVHQERAAGAPISALAFHPGGQILAVGTSDGVVRLWDLQGAAPRVLPRYEQPVTALAFHPGGQILAVGFDSGLIRIESLDRSGTLPTVLFARLDGWLSIIPETKAYARVLRHDDGYFLPSVSVAPLRPAQPAVLSVRPEVLVHPGNGPDPVQGDKYYDWGTPELRIHVTNTGQGRAYWIGVEEVELPPGLQLVPPRPHLRLEPGETATLDVRLFWISPDNPPVPRRQQRMRVRVVHAHDTTEPVSVPVDLRAPVIALASEPSTEQDSAICVLENTGSQSVWLEVRALFVEAENACPTAESRALEGGLAQREFLQPAAAVTMAFAIPGDLAGKKLRLCLIARSATDIASTSRTWRLEAEVVPPRVWLLYLAIGLAALVLVVGVIVLRVYRNPVVTRARRQPEAVKSYPLDKLPEVDSLLSRARERTSTLTAAGVPTGRWALAVAAGRSPEQAIDAVAQAVGGTVGRDLGSEPAGPHRLPANTIARELRLPELRVRFARDTVLAAVAGHALEDGAARALVEALHQGGRGPRQALVLDLTDAQDVRQRLEPLAMIQTVTLAAETVRDLLFAEQPAHFLESVLADQIALVELSPYQTTSGVQQDSLFFGRDKELRLMTDRALRSFILVGARQMGKTSLLQAMERRLSTRGDVEVRYVSLARIGDIVDHLERSLRKDEHGSDASDAAAPAENDDARDAASTRAADSGASDAAPAEAAARAGRFRHLAAGTREQPRLWLVDEADVFVQQDAQQGHVVASVMRQLTQEGLAYFVLAGYWELYVATAFDYQHPLLNFAELLRLDPLDEKAAVRLATEPIEALGLCWDADETVQHLVAGAGRRANLIVLACKGMLHTLPRDSRTLTRAQLDVVVRTDRDLADALRVDRRLAVLDRAVVYQALAMDHAPRFDEVVAALRACGLSATTTELELAHERLIVAHALVDDEEGRLRCPVPFLEERLRRDGDLAARAREFVGEQNARPPRA